MRSPTYSPKATPAFDWRPRVSVEEGVTRLYRLLSEKQSGEQRALSAEEALPVTAARS